MSDQQIAKFDDLTPAQKSAVSAAAITDPHLFEYVTNGDRVISYWYTGDPSGGEYPVEQQINLAGATR